MRLCLEGTAAEFEGRIANARLSYQQAWERAENHAEACMAAHYRARLEPDPTEALAWDVEALRRAEAAPAESVAPFYPSLHLALGSSLERVGRSVEAQAHYDRAAALGVPHQRPGLRRERRSP
ncbi:MAG: hypothetical protein AB7L66_15840 [Gemmatimonadales bacterium]